MLIIPLFSVASCVVTAFRCGGLWPRSAAHWPSCAWPSPTLAAEVKNEGFDLLSKESPALQGKQSSMEGDAWVLSFVEAEERLLSSSPGRKKTLACLKTLRDRHLDCLPGNPVTCYHLKVFIFFSFYSATYFIAMSHSLSFHLCRLSLCSNVKSILVNVSGMSQL